jgi:hypothetical protein
MKAKTPERLALITAQEFFKLRRKGDLPALVAKLSALMVGLFADSTELERRQVRRLVAQTTNKPALRAPPEILVTWLRERAGREGLVQWVLANGPPQADRAGAVALVREWILAEADPRRLFEAAIRFGVGRATAGDEQLIELSFNSFTNKENAMVNFTFDPRGLPATFDAGARALFNARVTDLLANTFGLPVAGNEITYGAITGILLLNEHFDKDSVTFKDDVLEAWNETLAEVLSDPAGNPARVSSRAAYAAVANKLDQDNLVPKVPVPDPADPQAQLQVPSISYQQFAFVSRYVVAKSEDVWLLHPNLSAQIRIGLDQYVAGPPVFDSLTLPPLGDDAQISDSNVDAVGTIGACYYLERARLIDALDSIINDFGLGKIPIGFDAAGRALDEYRTIPSQKLLTPLERHSIYSRVLGFAGGDVPKDVIPNKEFETLLNRFIASIAEYDRQRRLNGIFAAGARPLAFTGELVRKAGNDLGRNSSLYGFAGTQFDARRISEMVQRALRILQIPALQRAYGVTNPYQLMERVAGSNGYAINVVKYKTMAESVKSIMHIVAKYAKVWSSTAGRPLFNDAPAMIQLGVGQGVLPPVDINDADRDTLLNNVQYWLAVTGTGDQQIEQNSRPVESKPTSSIPMLGAGGGGGDAMDKLKQIVQGGQAPSLEQLQQLIPH